MLTDKKNKSQVLYRLSELKDFKVSDKDPDVRGWTVIGIDGERMGKVEELIVDPGAGKVRYLDVEIEKDLIAGVANRHILLPIGAAKLHESNDVIIVNFIDINKLRYYPVYHGEEITRDYEHSLRESIGLDTQFFSSDDKWKDISRMREEVVEAEQAKARIEIETNSNDPLVRLKAERDIAIAERDIARAERDILKVQIETNNAKGDDDFYNHKSFNSDGFYENRRYKELSEKEH